MRQRTSTQASSESPSPDPEDLTADLPGFAQPPSPTTDPLDPSVTTIGATSSESSHDDGASWADVDEEEAPHRGSEGTTGSSRASTDRTVPRANWQDLMPMIGALVGMASLAVRWVRSRRRPLPEGVWIADEEDQAAIAAPLARMAARRSPIGSGESADLVDGVEVLVGAAGYAMKNLEHEAAYVGLVEAQPPTDDA